MVARLWEHRGSASLLLLSNTSLFAELESSFSPVSVVSVALGGCGQVATGSGVGPTPLLGTSGGGQEVRQGLICQLSELQKAFQEGKLGLDIGKNMPTHHSLAVFKSSEVPVKAGMEANLFGVLEIGDQRANL